MKSRWLSAGLVSAVVLGALVAVAGPDTFFLGRSGVGGVALSVPAAGTGQPTTVQVNTYARVTSTPTNPPVGLPQLTFDQKRRGVVARNAQSNDVESDDFAVGKLVMIIQTTGIAPSALPAAGTEQEALELTNSPVGRWELAEIQSYNSSSSTGTMVLTEPLKYTYLANSTQIVSVPEYLEVNVANGAKIEPLEWDGDTGGVVAFLVNGDINLNSTGSINAAAKGARGGQYSDETGNATSPGCTTENADGTDLRLGKKGEGLSSTRFESSNPARGRMNLTSGGGGGICASSGGGGGGNGGLGGMGGESKELSPRPVGGLGGAPLSYSLLDHLTLGGGGGSGQGAANVGGSHGGNGGGIIFVRAKNLEGGSVNASGELAPLSTESGGGGGAGGTISIRLTQACSTTSISATGGNGGSVDVEHDTATPAPAPGGGGGGGRVLLQARESDCAISVAAGTAGRTKAPSNGSGVERGAQPLANAALLPPHVGTVTFLTGALIEATAPVLNPGLPPRTNDPTLTVSGTGTRNAGLLVYRQNTTGVYEKVAQTVIDSTGNFSLEVPLAEGSNSLRFAVELKGLQGPSTVASTVVLDTTPPDTTASTALALPTNAASITFTVTATDPGTGACSACPRQCRLTLPSHSSAPGYGNCLASYTLTETGTYKFEARATDLAGNVDPTPAVINFMVDRAPPDVAIKTTDPVPPAPFTRATTASVGFRSNAADFLRFECQLNWEPAGGGTNNPGSWATCPSTHFLTNLQNGRRYTLVVRAVDTAGNESSTVNHVWTVDTVSPPTEIIAMPAAETQLNEPFTFRSLDPSIGDNDFECSLDGLPFADCTREYTPSLTVVEGQRSEHTLLVRARDAAGNVDESPASYTWVIDNDNPDVSLTALDTRDPSNATRTGFDFNSNATDVDHFECQLNWEPAGGGATTTGTWGNCPPTHVVSDLRDGRRYTLVVRAEDKAGNESGTVSHSWTVDTVSPDTSITVMPPAETQQRVAQPFTFDSLDPTIGDDDFECSLDGDDFEDCSSPYTPDLTPAENVRTVHRLLVRAKDAAGNVDESPARYTWAIDNQDPDTAISLTSPAPPPNPDTSLTAVFGFTSPATDLARFECRLNLPPGDNDWHLCPASHSISNLVDGTTYTLSVRAVDLAGNVDVFPADHTWRVDNTKPDTQLDSRCLPDALTSLLDARFSYRSTDSDVAFFECSYDGGQFARCDLSAEPPNPADPRCTTNYYQQRVADGSHKMLIRAVDTAGNRDDTPATHAWRVTSDAVTTEITDQPEPLTNLDIAPFEFTSNRGNVTFMCKLDELAEVPCGSITGTTRFIRHTFGTVAAPLPDGTHTLNVYAVDTDPEPDVRDNQGAFFTWKVDTEEPKVSPPITEPTREFVNTTTLTIRGTAQEQGTVTVYLGELVVGRTDTSALLTWEVPNVLVAEQTYILRTTLTDEANNAGLLVNSTPRSITVDFTRPDTRITEAPLAKGRQRVVSFSFAAQDELHPDGFECRIGVDGLFEPCTSPYSFTAPQDGSYQFQVRAVDKAGNADATPALHSWSVDATPPETAILTKPESFDRSERSRFTFDSTENGVGSRFECRLNEGEFRTCDSSFAPSPLPEGTYTLQVKAVDAVGNEDASPETYTWTVDDTDPELPTVDFPVEGSPVETRTPQFRGTAGGEASEVVIFVDGTERGRASVDEAGQWRFTAPGELPNGEHSVSVYAVDRARNESGRTPLRLFQVIPSTEIDSRGGGLSCALGGGGGSPLATLGLIGLALLAAHRRRRP